MLQGVVPEDFFYYYFCLNSLYFTLLDLALPQKQVCGCVHTSEIHSPCPRSKPQALYSDF